MEKAFFFPRFVAYIIDLLIVMVVSSTLSYCVPQSKNVEIYTKESNQILNEYKEQKISTKEYFNKVGPVAYDLDKANLPISFVSIVVAILYFIVFQYYNKGQTLGKKLMKLKVVSTNDQELSINQIAIRALFINIILFNLLIIGMVLFLNKDIYIYFNLGLEVLTFIFMITSLIFILYRKDGKGLHDMIAQTKVVSNN